MNALELIGIVAAISGLNVVVGVAAIGCGVTALT